MRTIAEAEIAQLLWNRYRTAHNPNGADPERRFLIGTTNGGRCLTVVIAPTADPTTWAGHHSLRIHGGPA